MKSLPAAMTWELFDRGRWSLPAAALGALAFPTLLFTALNREGALDPNDRIMFIMQIIMMQFNMMAFGAALASGNWKLNRLYAYPISSASLVAWRLLPGMLMIAIETVLWTAAINAIFHLNWPLWGPAMFAAAALACVSAAGWIADRSRWIIFTLTVVAVVLGFWFKSRFGGMFSDPLHQWAELTPSEFFTLLAFAGAAYWIAVIGVARNRRGEPPFTLGLIARLERLFDRLFDHTSAPRPAFRTPADAQFWFECRNLWLMPVAVLAVLIACMTIFLGAWLLGGPEPQQLVEALWMGSRIMLGVAALGGLVMGNIGGAGDLKMGPYLATRPMTTAAMVRSLLRAAAVSLLLAWAAWAAAVLAVYGILWACGAAPSPWLPKALDWRDIPATFVGSWIILAGWISLALTGRATLIVRMLVALTSTYIGVAVAAKFALSPEMHAMVFHAIAAGLGAVFLIGTAGALAIGRRRGLIDTPTAWSALAAWSALVVVGVLLFPYSEAIPATSYLLAVGVLALAVAPLAAAPLALAWNRHR
jgi:hypothetical protein